LVTGEKLWNHQKTPRIAPGSFGQTCCQRGLPSQTTPSSYSPAYRGSELARHAQIDYIFSDREASTFMIRLAGGDDLHVCKFAGRGMHKVFGYEITCTVVGNSNRSRFSIDFFRLAAQRPLNTLASIAQKNQSGSRKTISGSIFPEYCPKLTANQGIRLTLLALWKTVDTALTQIGRCPVSSL
jgi:hypothetical protein